MFDDAGASTDLLTRLSMARHDARRVEMPFDQQPIGRQAAMKRAGRDAVQIRMIFPANGPKPVQYEVRVCEVRGGSNVH